jgi:hypothetical protein
MRDWTGTELKEKVVNDLDLSNETSIKDAEYLGYMNEAIDEAEASIHRLGVEDEYFLEWAWLSLVSGTNEYAMPTNIYANKIRGIFYQNGGEAFEIRRSRDSKKMLQAIAAAASNDTSRGYEYFILNTTAGAPRIRILPRVLESGAYVKIYYIRNANRLTVEADVCDIPEFINVVFTYLRFKVLSKEIHPLTEEAKAAHEAALVDMEGTLANMVPDTDNFIEADMSHYEEHT